MCPFIGVSIKLSSTRGKEAKKVYSFSAENKLIFVSKKLYIKRCKLIDQHSVISTAKAKKTNMRYGVSHCFIWNTNSGSIPRCNEHVIENVSGLYII